MKHRHKLRTTFCTIISLETAQYLCYNLTFLKLYNVVIVEYNKAIRLNPNNDSTYKNRGVAKYKLDRIREAKQDFQTALKLAEQASLETR